MTLFARYWINQPSTLQPCHDLHGTNVIATIDDMVNEHSTVDVAVLDSGNPIISMRVPKLCLSKGTRP